MAYLPQPTDLPKYNPPGYSAPAPNPSGAYMRLPVEKTVGGFRDNIWENPRSTDIFDPNSGSMTNLPFNPFTQGYMKGGEWNPYLPDKLVYGQRDNLGPVPKSLGGGQASQMINGKWYNIGANNYEAGQTGPNNRPFETSAPSVAPSQTAAAPFTGMMFGNKWYEGLFDKNNQFNVAQPKQPTTTNPDLGIFKPWNPALNALQTSRSQP